jgi:hypothetical protein
MTADYCAPFEGGVVCGTKMKEGSRRSEGVRWCFCCRKRVEFHYIVMVPDGESWYGPYPEIKCSGCNQIDGDLFPGRTREWEEW